MQFSKRQKRRKLAQLKGYACATLQPCMESYGVKPTSVTAVTNEGTHLTFQLSEESSTSNEIGAVSVTENKTARTLFLLDKYRVSDEFYHELAQVQQVVQT